MRSLIVAVGVGGDEGCGADKVAGQEACATEEVSGDAICAGPEPRATSDASFGSVREQLEKRVFSVGWMGIFVGSTGNDASGVRMRSMRRGPLGRR